MTSRVHSVPRHRRISTRRTAVVPLLAIVLAAVAAAPAEASRAPTGSEAKAIKKAFLKGRVGEPTIRKIRVSTVDTRFAAVFYETVIEKPSSSRTAAVRTSGPTKYTPPPVILKEGKGKWKTVPKAPKPVKKDLKVKDPRSDIVISGEVSAVLTRPASCTDSGDFYSAGIYDPEIDLYLSIEIPQYAGHGWYPARGVGSVAGLYSNSGTVLQYETGQAHDAFASSGDILAEGGWGIIEAGMARTPPDENTQSNTVSVNGTWACG
jgi:hypothetical protein